MRRVTAPCLSPFTGIASHEVLQLLACTGSTICAPDPGVTETKVKHCPGVGPFVVDCVMKPLLLE